MTTLRCAPVIGLCAVMKKMILTAGSGLFVFVFLAAAGVGTWLATSLHWLWPIGENLVVAPGLENPVRVVRDDYGVPHLFAENELDAYFALGFVHAQDRFWQMESMRRFGAGRLAEVVGKPLLVSDKWMRTMGFYALAEAQTRELPSSVLKVLEAYAKGINHWMKIDFGMLTLETSLLGYQPEPWRPADSLVWGKIMASRLGGNWRGEALRAEIAKRIGPEKARELWPAYPADAPIPAAGLTGLYTLAPWPFNAPKGASNVWALGRSKTDTGGALLANDPHLGFSAPVLWYLARMKTPDLMIIGATVPGVPFHVLGHNGQIAWGITSTQSDITDLFVEKLSTDEIDSYMTTKGASAFITREEIIKVKDAKAVKLTVRATIHGPVISDLRPRLGSIIDESHVVALCATYLKPGDISAAALFELNRAKDWTDFNRALAKFQGPQQNFAYADTAGNVGFLTAGLVPIRGQGQGYVPNIGWSGEADWTGMVPFAELPKLYKPASDIIVNANNRIAPPGFRYFLGYDWAVPYRARRIRQLLGDETSQSVATVGHMQHDAHSLMADELLPLMLDVKVKERMATKTLHLLRRWNRIMERGKAEPLIFMAWLLELNRALYGDDLGDLTNAFLSTRPLLVKSILTRRQHWCDDISTKDKQETCADILFRSFDAAVKGLAKRHGDDQTTWRWGTEHKASFANQVLGQVPVLGALANLKIESDGGNATVNRGAMSLNNQAQPFAHIHGPGYRAVYDLNDLKRSRFTIATGQSGNPFSSHYRDQMEPWRNGRTFRITGSRRELSEGVGFVLAPVGGK